jgi:hypothetical protein
MSISLLVVAGVTLSACGPLGDDDPDPTATAESIQQPTETSTDEATETVPAGATEEVTEAVEDGTPSGSSDTSATPSAPRPFDRGTPVPDDAAEATTQVISVSTPALDLDDSSDSTPVPAATEPEASPENSNASAIPTEPAGGEGSGTNFAGSDGTSGATPDSESEDEPVDETSDESTPFFVRDDQTPDVATPVNDGTPSAVGTPVAGDDASIADIEPAVVTSCDPEIVPAVTIAQVDYLTAEDVNFRTGPGADCDLIGTGPIGVNAAVTLLGGPVAREGEDFVWVQVDIAGEVGWIVVEVLEPAA